MHLKVLFHDSCFDGAASAALFTRFYLDRINPRAKVTFEGLAHKAGGEGIDDSVFTGDQNAIVDFRYSQHPKLNWWFDHHRSAFQKEGDEAHFRADASGKKFHDEKRKSCTKYLADVVEGLFGWDPAPYKELIHWGELIDGAAFESPRQAVELAEPALQIMSVLEANRSPAFTERLIWDFQSMPLEDIVRSDYVERPLRPLLERHKAAIEIVKKKAVYEDGIVTFDVGDEGLDTLNKFISYYLYPEARYTVWVGKGDKRAKVSIGSNPWRPETRKHDLSKIAERFGGGGHPVVAAMSFKPEELPRARQVAAEILAELKA